jgi:dihydrolipoamide dehydrogenase
MSSEKYDIAIIGAGPGGYVCAIRAAQLGLKVALIDKNPEMGGTCLNVGCIPSKALLHSTEVLHQVQHGEKHGIKTGKIEVDLSAMMSRKDKVVDQLRKGIQTLLSKRKVDIITGMATLKSATEIAVKGPKESTTITAENIVLATGSVPVGLPFLKFDGKDIISSDEAIALKEIPKSMIVVGAGAIGLELGSVWSRLGTEVTVVEFLPAIAAGSDEDVSKLAERIFKKQGIKFSTNTKVTAAKKSKGGITLTAEKNGKELTFEAEKVLVAVGRKPFSEGLGLEAAGLKADDKGRIPVKSLQTGVKNIWAIGDLIEGPMLAHKAEEEGVAVAEKIAGNKVHLAHDLIPGVIYTHPEIASVGLTEKAAKDQDIEVKIGKFTLLANGRAIAQDATDGMVKIIADAKTDKVLGAAIIAAGASEMIASIVAHMTYGGSAEDIAHTIHAHPTISESIKEAALDVDKKAIHSL